MKKVCSVVLMAIFSGMASGQRIRIVDGDQAETTRLRGEAIQASVMLQEPGRDSYREAALDGVFLDGQRFRLRVSAARDGYLYVLCGNSQGSAVILFPADSNMADNRMRESRRVTIPEEGWFRFDEEPGIERVYLLLADSPIADLDRAARTGRRNLSRSAGSLCSLERGPDQGNCPY